MTQNNLLRISVSQATNLFGVSERTIRNAIKQKQLHYVIVRNRYKINFDSLLEWSQKSTRRRNRRDSLGIGQHVATWRIRNKKFSPNPALIKITGKMITSKIPLSDESISRQTPNFSV